VSIVTSRVIQQLQQFFAHDHAGIACVYLYGSTARGQPQRTSDIDVAVLYDQEPPPTLAGLGLELGARLERCLDRPVDLLILNRAPVDLIHRVLRDGVLIYDGNPSMRIRFEVQARNEYFDLLPYLRQYRGTVRNVPL
jgi:predicted nucleotidyltransferase